MNYPQTTSNAAEQAGNTGRLILDFAVAGGKTVIRDGSWTAPLKVAKPFYLDRSGEAFVYIMNPSGGMVGGDRYMVEVNLEEKAAVFLTTQSAAKIYKTPGCAVGQRCTFKLAEGALLEYFPDPVIPFAGSRFHGETEIFLAGRATVFMGEILAPGRVRRGEVFQFSRYFSRTRVYDDSGIPVLWDVLDLEPGRRNYKSRGMYEDYTHLAQLFLFSEEAGPELAGEIHEFIAVFPNLLGSASLTCRGGVAVRLLGYGCGELEKVLRGCWNLARQKLFGRPVPGIRK